MRFDVAIWFSGSIQGSGRNGCCHLLLWMDSQTFLMTVSALSLADEKSLEDTVNGVARMTTFAPWLNKLDLDKPDTDTSVESGEAAILDEVHELVEATQAVTA